MAFSSETTKDRIKFNIPPPFKPFLIGVAGGTASGKTSICNCIVEDILRNHPTDTRRKVVIIGLDSFYRSLTDDEQLLAQEQQFNFDHPNAFDFKSIKGAIQNIRNGKQIEVYEYDYKNNCRKEKPTIISPADVVLVEGILTFYLKDIREMFDMKLFVDTDSDTRLTRRVMRDVQELNRSLDQTLENYIQRVKPAFEDFCLPTKKYADVIIPRGSNNKIAIELIVQHIQDLLLPSNERRTKTRQRTVSETLFMHRQTSMEPVTPTTPTSEKYTSAH